MRFRQGITLRKLLSYRSWTTCQQQYWASLQRYGIRSTALQPASDSNKITSFLSISTFDPRFRKTPAAGVTLAVPSDEQR